MEGKWEELLIRQIKESWNQSQERSNQVRRPPSCITDMGKPPFKASEGGFF